MKTVELIPGLKSEVRTGWSIEGVPHPESVADHTWGMTLLLLHAFDRTAEHGEEGIDRERTLRIAIVHDLQEAVTGDLVVGRHPKEMTAEEKRRRGGESGGRDSDAETDRGSSGPLARVS